MSKKDKKLKVDKTLVQTEEKDQSVKDAEFKEVTPEAEKTAPEAEQVKEEQMDIQQKVEQNETAKEEITQDLLDTYTAEDTKLEDELKELEAKKAKILEAKKQKEEERKVVEDEVKKLTPVLSGGLKEILKVYKEARQKQEELKQVQEKLSELSKTWRTQAQNSKLSEELINKLLPTSERGRGGAKVDTDKKKEAILEGIRKLGAVTMNQIYKLPMGDKEVGMSQNTRNVVAALKDEDKKIIQNKETGKYQLT